MSKLRAERSPGFPINTMEDISEHEYNDLLVHINTDLAALGVPEVDMELLRWRVNRLLRYRVVGKRNS